jgi:hypothetical protein
MHAMKTFDEKYRDEVWSRAAPREGMRDAFEFLLAEAHRTKDNKATQQEAKDALGSDITSMEWNLRTLEAISLSDKVCRVIHDALLRADWPVCGDDRQARDKAITLH